jgi:hypothetical protein
VTTDVMRHEQHAATTRTAASTDAAKQMLMPYRGRNKLAAIQPGFEFKPGYIYTQVRAISARINQNYDGWPSEELKKSFKTFIGKPVFVNHQNFDPKKARGKVVASRYIANGDDKYIETVMEIDAQRFPKLAHEIKTGGMDSVSMGVEAGFTICSYCNNKAVDEPEFCSHVRYHKGRTLPRTNHKTGAKEDVLVYEKCYKLGFFELSYVFDPADETAVVSRVISAAAAPPPPMDMPIGNMPTDPEGMPTSQIEAKIDRLAYGEIEAPEDIDTLRDDEGDTQDDDFKHFVESPKELKGPDLDQTKLRDQQQEDQGLDRDRRAEDVEDVGGLPMSARRRQAGVPSKRDPAGHAGLTPLPEEQYRSKPRSKPDPNAWDYDDYGAGEEERQARPPHHDESAPPPHRGAPGDIYSRRSAVADVLVDPRTGRRYYAASDDDLLQEAEEDLEKADKSSKDDFSDDPGSDAGGTDDDASDSDSDDDDDDSDDDSDSDSKDLPPWLKGKGGDDDDDDGPPPPPSKESRRNGNQRSSNQKKRGKGAPMSLQERGRTATAGRRRHYADDNGHFDGGPYHLDDNDQGEMDGNVYITPTPPAKSFDPPVPGDSPISNTESILVEGRLRKRIQQRNAELRRDLIAYEQITGRRVTAGDGDDGNWPNPGPESGVATEKATTVNPTVPDPAARPMTNKGFDDVALDHVETQPDNGRSARAFRAFDQWLQRATGRTAAQHGNPNFIRRSAARYCQTSGVRVESLFPALGSVLREARRNEGGDMRRRADAGAPIEYAAPQERTDVPSPVSNTTDAQAQASQPPANDFDNNAGARVSDPDLYTDTQIWAPGEKPAGFGTKKDSNRKADGITAVRYAEAFIAAGLAPNTPEEKWKIAGLAQTMRHGTIVDRISLLDAVNTTRQAAARRTAGANRGAARGLPQGVGQRQLTGGSSRMAANDIATDQAMFFK